MRSIGRGRLVDSSLDSISNRCELSVEIKYVIYTCTNVFINTYHADKNSIDHACLIFATHSLRFKIVSAR